MAASGWLEEEATVEEEAIISIILAGIRLGVGVLRECVERRLIQTS